MSERKAMKLQRAIFDFDGAQIVFNHAAADVTVDIWGKASVTYMNKDREYKPCVTHCKQLLARVESERPKRKVKT